jgi:D-alanyl-D-alanine dipeptidase
MSACGGSTSESYGAADSDTTSDLSGAKAIPVQMVSTELKTIPFEESAIYVERMYATSTGKYGPENVLDGDPATYWEAMPGAGGNEGIMLYFPEAVKVSKLRITAPKSSGITRLEVFVNGSNQDQISPNQNLSIDEEVRSLFVRVFRMGGDQLDRYYLNDGYGEVLTSAASQTASISDIELYGSNGELLKVRPLHLESGRAIPSSTLAPVEAYSADYLFDSRNEFGWAEGVAGSGEGQTIKFSFDRDVRIEKIKIWNGYQRSQSHFERNARAKGIQFGPQGGASDSYELADKQGAQVVNLTKPLQGKSFDMKINSVFAGKSYQDLVLSEMRFFDGKRWFALYSGDQEARKNALQHKVMGTSLESVLDRNLADATSYNFDNEKHERSLLLRSNGSFVLYLSDFEMAGKDGREIRQVADGNWEIIQLGKDQTRIKIFGKIHRIRDKIDLYKGTSSSESTRIFNEFLNVSTEWVRGEKLLDSLRTGLGKADLVDCGTHAPGTQIEMRYATDNNFMKEYLYSECLECMLRSDVAKALGKAKKLLDQKSSRKYVFHVWDAYRPYQVQKAMWEKIKDPKYVADPYNGGSSHNKGAAIDLTLALKDAKNNETLPMGTDFDFFGEEAHHGFAGLTDEEKANRKLLKEVMEGAGFKPLSSEWWHYSFPAPDLKIIDVNQDCDY